MLIDEIKKANIQAMKERNLVKKNAFSLIISKYQVLLTSANDKKIEDSDLVSIINKTIKELKEEQQMYLTNNRKEKADEISIQIDALNTYLPKMMDEKQIRQIISKLTDKSIKSIMTEFKTKYNGQVDFSLVSKIAKEFN